MSQGNKDIRMPSWTPGSMHKSKFSPETNWIRQWRRFIRWSTRVETLKRKAKNEELSESDFDIIFTYFQNCFFLRDWIKHSVPAIEPKIKKLFNEEWELCLVRDICNGTKHCKITAPSVDAEFEFYRECDHFSNQTGPAAIQYNILVGEDELKKIGVFHLADRCREILESFLTKEGLKTP